MLYNPLCYSLWKSQLLSFLSHPSNSSIFKQLHPLLCDGGRPSLLFSITSELFLSPRGWYPSLSVFRCNHSCRFLPPPFSLLPVSAWSVSRTIVRFVRSVPTPERSHQGFLVKNTPNAKSCDACPSHSMLYIAIQCTETPFGERFGAIPPTPVD